MLLRVLVLVCALAPATSNASAGKLVRVDFTGEIQTVIKEPFGQPSEYWRLKKVTGYFVYDPATPNALTPEQVKKKRTVRIFGTKRTRTFQHQTEHIYLQNLMRPGLELKFPGHKISGSGRSMIEITYRELDTMNNQFLYYDGNRAYLKYKNRHKHGHLMVDGVSRKNASFRLHFFDQGQKLKSANLPKEFPFVVGDKLHLGGSIDVDGHSVGFKVIKMSWKTIPR